MKVTDIEQLVTILKNSDLTELELEQNGVHLRLSRNSARTVVNTVEVARGQIEQAIMPSQGAPTTVHTYSNGAAASKPAVDLSSDKFVKVESPIVGTFYRRPSPEAEPFAKEGDFVKKGSTLCIIEAMKLMNEIESPCDGKIEKVFLNDGKVVEFGETIFLINPSA